MFVVGDVDGAEEKAGALAAGFAVELGLGLLERLVVRNAHVNDPRRQVDDAVVTLKYDRTYDGLRVESARVAVDMTLDGVVRRIRGMTSPITIDTIVPAVSSEESQRIAKQSVLDSLPQGPRTMSRADLIIFKTNDAEPRLAWNVTVRPVDEQGRPYAGHFVCVDAQTRTVLLKQPAVLTAFPPTSSTAWNS